MHEATANELKEWRAQFEQWMTPSEMDGLQESLAMKVDMYLLTQRGIEFLRDAWVACRFAKLRGATKLRLLEPSRYAPSESQPANPDCEMIVANQVSRFEITEAMRPGRLRTKEYQDEIEARRAKKVPGFEDDYDNWQCTGQRAIEMLNEVAGKKANKGYAKTDDLVILFQDSAWPSRVKEIEQAMPEGTAIAKDAFREVWLLWSNRFYPIWRSGQRVIDVA